MARASVMLTVVSCLALMMLGTGASRMLQTCGKMSCPSGYELYKVNNYFCDYACMSPLKLNCYSKLAPPATNQKLSQPYLCGGTSGKPCPTISCAYVSTYSVSGANGCSTAFGAIDALAISSGNYSYVEAFAMNLKSYCANPSAYPLQAFAWSAANAYADAIAKTFVHWHMALCNCGCGTANGNLVKVKADVQAVATAVAEAYAAAIATVETCFGDLLAGTLLVSEALAKDTALAFESVYASIGSVASTSPTCKSDTQTKIKTAIAKAAACTFAQAFAAAANEKAMDDGVSAVAYACGASISFTDVDLVCPPYGIGCECTPENLGYTNLGFENGIPGSNPTWSVEQAVQAVTSANDLTLYPSQGNKMAQITAGCSTPSVLSGTIKVPQCIDNYGSPRILLDYVFKCNDYLPYNDAAGFSITLYDSFGTVTASKTLQCSDVGNFGATNDGKWSTLVLNAAPGTYEMKIEASAVNTLDCGLSSSLYVDNIRFS